MEISDQQFLAREGVVTWCHGVVAQAHKLSNWNDALQDTIQSGGFQSARREFERDRLFLLVSAQMFFEYRDWAVNLSVFPVSTFALIDPFRQHVKELRDMNIHVVEYFQGTGYVPDKWLNEDDLKGTSDASATFETFIGGRLNWHDLSLAAQSILDKIKPM